MTIQAAVTCSNLKKIYTSIAKKPFAIFSHAYTSTTTDAMALKFLQTLSSYYNIKLTLWMIFESDQNWRNSDQSFE